MFYRSSRLARPALLAAFVIATLSAAAGEKPYVWPQMPDPEAFTRARLLTSGSGIVILDRDCQLEVATFGGVKREEFVRFLVLDSEGARNATITVNDQQRARVDTITARTVAPDGTVTPADAQKDIHTTELGVFKAKEALVSVATVRFPAPVAGSVLDLHFVTVAEGFTYYYGDPVTFGQYPAMKTHFVIKARGGLPGTQWCVTLLGGRAGMGRLERKPGDVIEADFGLLTPGREEPSTVPYTQRDTSILLYLQWEFYDNKDHKQDIGYHFDVDRRGRPAGLDWQNMPMKDWWLSYLKESEENVARFLRHPGRAKSIPIAEIAPVTLPLETRLEKLYAYVQANVAFNPDAEDLTDLSDVMRKGESANWQGTLLFMYLLDRAGIPHTDVLVADRWMVRFSPLITNSYVYGMADAVFVDIPGKGRRFFMPGDLSLPFGCLANGYQDSLALWRPDDKTLAGCLTPLNPYGADRTEYRYEGAFTADGTVSGTLTVCKWGDAAAEFVNWYRVREFRRIHLKKQDKKRQPSAEELGKELEDHLRKAVAVPGTRLDLKDLALVSFPVTSADPLRITCSFTGRSMGQPAGGGTWTILDLPPMAGYANPFTADKRETPIWFDESGRTLIDGVLALPAGSKVMDVPGPWQFSGPDGATLRCEVEAGGQGPVPALKTHLEFDRPIIVGTDQYSVWRVYETNLASRGESRCLVTLPAAKALE